MIVYMDLEVRAYSPYDQIDEDYHRKFGRSRTSRGNDSSSPGIASTFPKGTKCIVPGFNFDKPTECDDSGAYLRHRNKWSVVCIEIRIQSEAKALEWGVKKLRVAVLIP